LRSFESEWKAALARRRARLPADTNAYRGLDGEWPQLTVDLFGAVAIASSYCERSEDEVLDLTAAIAAQGPRTVYWKRRPREARRAANEAAEQVAPPRPHLGPPVEAPVAREAGLAFSIRPANGLSVGLYLDARDARIWVREHARGRTVLNLFAYTCGFGVAALAGGSIRALNLDASRKVLDWGEANCRLNGFAPEKADFVAGDARQWLKRLAKKREQFGLVILDPPSFASVGKSRWSAATQYPDLVEEALACVAPGGHLLACCNLAQWTRAQFAAVVKEAAPGAKLGDQFGASAVDFAQPSAFKAVALRV
jgi:23S rRNA (cytosine1962-C5)-methyltransferase